MSFNVKLQIPNDIPAHNQYIPHEVLKSQSWLKQINDWTINQKVRINEKKTKCMIFNQTNNYQFTTRLFINNQPIEVIKNTRLLGTFLQDNLCWDLNTKEIVNINQSYGKKKIYLLLDTLYLDIYPLS